MASINQWGAFRSDKMPLLLMAEILWAHFVNVWIIGRLLTKNSEQNCSVLKLIILMLLDIMLCSSLVETICEMIQLNPLVNRSGNNIICLKLYLSFCEPMRSILKQQNTPAPQSWAWIVANMDPPGWEKGSKYNVFNKNSRHNPVHNVDRFEGPQP